MLKKLTAWLTDGYWPTGESKLAAPLAGVSKSDGRTELLTAQGWRFEFHNGLGGGNEWTVKATGPYATIVSRTHPYRSVAEERCIDAAYEKARQLENRREVGGDVVINTADLRRELEALQTGVRPLFPQRET